MKQKRGQGLRLQRGSGGLGAKKRIGGGLKTLKKNPSGRMREIGGGAPPFGGQVLGLLLVLENSEANERKKAKNNNNTALKKRKCKFSKKP